VRKACNAFSLVELVAVAAITLTLGAVIAPAGWKLYEQSSLAISANNLRQLGAGAQNYLADHRFVYWKYVDYPAGENGVLWWFGFEPEESRALGEGKRFFDAERSPLAGYIPAALRPDPTFRFTGRAFKPKFEYGYLGLGYNVLLGGGWMGLEPPKNHWSLAQPGQTVVFATSAQVNTFQRPASRTNPMIEEFYGIDHMNTTVHFRHRDQAMVAFANGSAGFLPMDISTLDARAPKAKVGRFAPVGSRQHLE